MPENSEADRRSQERLAAKDREAFLRDVVDSVPQHVCVLDMNGTIQIVNEPWLRFAAENGSDATHVGVGVNYLDVCRQALAAGDESAGIALAGLQELISGTRRSFFVEYPCHSPDVQRWFALYASRLVSSRGGVIVSHLDVSDRKKAEEQVRLLMREANHRIKNMLALVEVIVRESAASAMSPDDFADRLSERIAALAASQDLLVSENGQGIALAQLVESQLAPFRDFVTSGRIVMHGTAVRIGASAAQTIGMALHELATNAIKYGALSNETGKVEIDWEMSALHDGGAEFELRWSESGGPPVREPAREGFGTTVIKRAPESALDARVALAFPPSGCRWRLVCPAERLGGS